MSCGWVNQTFQGLFGIINYEWIDFALTRSRPLFESGTISAGSSMLGTKTDGIIIQELRKS